MINEAFEYINRLSVHNNSNKISYKVQFKTMTNSLTSLKNILNRYLNKEFSNNNFKIDLLNSVFKTRIHNILFTNINFKDPRAFLDGVRNSVLGYVNNGIRKHYVIKVSCVFTGLFSREFSFQQMRDFSNSELEF